MSSLFFYCLGIRLNDSYNEVQCVFRDKCPYFKETDLAVILSRPDVYQELDTYNNEICKYYNKQ